jgi:general secretion pathway protein H
VSAPRRTRGFTFVETTVVLLIIALGTALAVPMIEGGMDAREVRRAARQIASTMHFCRGEAVTHGRPQELVIDPLRNGIHTTEWGRWAVLTERAVIADVQGGNDLGDGVVQVLFFPNGSTSGATVLVASRRDRFANRLRVDLDPLLGTVRVEDLAE